MQWEKEIGFCAKCWQMISLDQFINKTHECERVQDAILNA
jgi:hypothetical protein